MNTIINDFCCFLKKNYLNEFKYSNAEQDDLWRVLTDQAHKDKTLDKNLTVKEIMDTWTLQMGYPVIQVNRKGDKLILNQRWFLLNPLSKMLQPQNANEYNKHKWYVPFTFTTKTKPSFQLESEINWIKPDDMDRKLSSSFSSLYLILFFRISESSNLI